MSNISRVGSGQKKLPILINPAVASDIASAKQAISQEGDIITGTAESIATLLYYAYHGSFTLQKNTTTYIISGMFFLPANMSAVVTLSSPSNQTTSLYLSSHSMNFSSDVTSPADVFAKGIFSGNVSLMNAGTSSFTIAANGNDRLVTLSFSKTRVQAVGYTNITVKAKRG